MFPSGFYPGSFYPAAFFPSESEAALIYAEMVMGESRIQTTESGISMIQLYSLGESRIQTSDKGESRI